MEPLRYFIVMYTASSENGNLLFQGHSGVTTQDGKYVNYKDFSEDTKKDINREKVFVNVTNIIELSKEDITSYFEGTI